MVMRSAEVGDVLHDLVGSMVRRRRRDLSLTATAVLSSLHRHGPRRLGALAVAEGVAQPSMSVLIGQLEQLGYVERRSDPADGRVVLVATTPEGNRYLRRRARESSASYRVLLERLSEEEVACLEAALPALRRLVELATALPEPAPEELAARTRPPARPAAALKSAR